MMPNLTNVSPIYLLFSQLIIKTKIISFSIPTIIIIVFNVFEPISKIELQSKVGLVFKIRSCLFLSVSGLFQLDFASWAISELKKISQASRGL